MVFISLEEMPPILDAVLRPTGDGSRDNHPLPANTGSQMNKLGVFLRSPSSFAQVGFEMVEIPLSALFRGSCDHFPPNEGPCIV